MPGETPAFPMTQEYCEVENLDPEQHQKWLNKHGFKPNEDGSFPVNDFEGKIPVEQTVLYDNIRTNVSSGDYTALFTQPYDERVFVMVCGGPSLADHLDEIREKALQPEKYLVVCSNMTAKYLMEHDIKPHVHFILDPQEKKKFDVSVTSPDIDYWINVACHPAVFETLREQGIKPYAFLADFDVNGKAIEAVKESLQPGQPGMMAIQGGTMAGLRAMNLADAIGCRTLEYYGFDAAVQVKDGKARPYAYEKKRGEAIIEIQCDRCQEKFDTTLIFQKQVNEFIKWRGHLPWINIKIIGGGLISHYNEHIQHLERQKAHGVVRFTPEYKELQKQLHSEGEYGVTGVMYVPTIFHGVSQLAKQGPVSVLDYGSAGGKTMKAVREKMWLPPNVEDYCYDPFVEEYSAEPSPADFVICTDVMEHVEPECTKAVLDHIASLTLKMAFFSISLCPANKKLADGRNAHINLRDSEFWLSELKRRFILSEAKVINDTVLVVGQSIEAVRNEMRKRRVES